MNTTIRPPAHLWGVSAALEPLSGGHRNAVFRTVGLDEELVFKSTRRPPEAIDWLREVHDLARAAGFTVPRMLETREGALVAQGWTCEPYIPGDPCDPADLPEVRDALSRFHDLARDMPQRPGVLSSQDLLGAERGGDVDLGAMPAAVVALCREAWGAVSDGVMTLVHGDLNFANLLRCPDGRVTLIDWDECRRDLSLFDLAVLPGARAVEARALLAWEAACSWHREPDYARTMAGRL